MKNNLALCSWSSIHQGWIGELQKGNFCGKNLKFFLKKEEVLVHNKSYDPTDFTCWTISF